MTQRAALLDALAWQVELGATEAIGETPINRYHLSDPPPRSAGAPVPSQALKRSATQGEAVRTDPPRSGTVDPVEVARASAARAQDLDALKSVLENFEHCDLKRGARQLVFSDGRPGARLMIVGEAPGREEDLHGRPFVGRAGQLLDRMLSAIGLSRTAADLERAVYITNILPWRPPQNRDPTPDEIAMMKPFVARHIELASPDVVVAMGNISCQALLGRRGITRLRGAWTDALGLPCLPMFHPAYLLRQPSAKRDAWADLLDVADRLNLPVVP